jgi:hypothetical protein
VVLLFFTAFMGWAWLFRNVQNCGCFGRYLPMTPEEAILKNLLLLGLVAYAWNELEQTRLTLWPLDARLAWRAILAGLVAMATVGLVAVQAPYSKGMTPAQGGAMPGHPAQAEDRPLAGYTFQQQGRVKYDLSQGTYLVALLSESCNHCAGEVASLNRLMSDAALPPVVALVLGEAEDVRRFAERYHPAFPTQPASVLDFLKLIGEAPPRYILARDGRQLAFWDEQAPTREALLSALQNPKPQDPS